MSDAPLVTVVTPFHNTERYLREAIESVLAQTYQRWEYILVDNQSTDGSLAIAQEYARREPRIRVARTASLLPQDLNYSEALRQAGPGSRYCKIVQADDWIFPECLERMVAVAEAHPRVGVVGSYYLKGTEVRGGGLPYPSPILPGRDVCRLQLQTGIFVFGSPTTVLMRTDLVRETTPYYDPAAYHADTEACYRDLQRWDFGFVHQVLSFLRTDNAGRMAAVQTYFPYALDKFIVVSKYGAAYLTGDEYQLVLRRTRNAYFRLLGDALLTRREPAFWTYHREGLRTIGYELHWYGLWWYALLAVFDAVGNPKKALGRCWRALRG